MPAINKNTAVSDKEYADAFNEDDAPQDGTEVLPPEPAAEATEPSPPAPAEQTPSEPEMSAQQLKSWAGRLRAQQAELDAQKVAAASSSVNDVQTSSDEIAEEAGEGADEETSEQDDPRKALAEDFGSDFVTLITKLVENICTKQVGAQVGSVSATVDQVISDLQNERQQNHFNCIKDAHDDFMEVVESPEFEAWKAAQPPEDLNRTQRIIESGSAKEIVAMLTNFKRSKQPGADDDDSLDAAEGVRSGGISLPKTPNASDDFADAWNQA